MGFQSGIRAAVYWVHVGSAFLIWALATVLPVSNLALQRFCPEAKSLSSTECLFPLKWIVAGVLALDPFEKPAYEWPTSHSFLPVLFSFPAFHSDFSFRLTFFLSFSHATFLSSLLCLWQAFVSIISVILFLSFFPSCSLLPSRSRSSSIISHKVAACADGNKERQRQEQGQCNNISTLPVGVYYKSCKTVKLSKHPKNKVYYNCCCCNRRNNSLSWNKCHFYSVYSMSIHCVDVLKNTNVHAGAGKHVRGSIIHTLSSESPRTHPICEQRRHAVTLLQGGTAIGINLCWPSPLPTPPSPKHTP